MIDIESVATSRVTSGLIDLVVAAVGTLSDVASRLVDVLERIHSLATTAQRTYLVLDLSELFGRHFLEQVENRGEFLTLHKQNGLADLARRMLFSARN